MKSISQEEYQELYNDIKKSLLLFGNAIVKQNEKGEVRVLDYSDLVKVLEEES